MEKIIMSKYDVCKFCITSKEIEDLEEGGIDIFHLDVMDGSFVLILEWDYKISNTSVKQQQNHAMFI